MISNVSWDGAQSITFNISWDNSWRSVGVSPTFHDAIWVFVKVAPNGGPSWNHVTMSVTDEGTLRWKNQVAYSFINQPGESIPIPKGGILQTNL